MTAHHIHQPIAPDHGEHGANQRKLFIALLITAIVMIAEIIGGLMANSLALLSDAGHMLTDILSLGLSLAAMKLAQKPPTPSKTFGFHRLEILAAFFNGMLLFFMSFYIFYEAYHRLLQPEEIKGLFMLIVAFIGLLANGAGILLLRKSAHTSLNVKSAFFHIVGDTISSGGVILGGVIILYTGWYLVDPLLSIFIGLLILKGAYALIMESIDIFLEATPKDINMKELLDELRKIQGVKEVHHIHLWTITSGINAMSAHVLIDDVLISSSAHILKEIKILLHNKYRIEHSTIQFESESCGDDLLQDHVHS
ncbi:MAG: cation transporter [Deltaproteobacteria bacterium]|nr:cation transporter [Deltaproteobacteria bacterium]